MLFFIQKQYLRKDLKIRKTRVQRLKKQGRQGPLQPRSKKITENSKIPGIITPSEKGSLWNSRWQKRPNRSTNNGDMAEKAKRDEMTS